MKKKLFALLLAIALTLSLSAPVFAYTVPSDTVVYVTETGSHYHRWDCSHLKSVGASYPISYAEALGYSPCSRCNPEWLTGTYEPPESSSSGSSNHSSFSSHIPPTTIRQEPTPTISAESDVETTSSNNRFFSASVKVAAVVLLGVFLLPIILGTLHSLFACSISVFRKKEQPRIDRDQKQLPAKTSASSAVPAPVSAPMPVPQILGQPAALYTLLSPDLLQSSDYTSALQSFSFWAQTCGFSVHRAFSFSDVCFPNVPLKQRTEFMALLSLCKQADRPFDVLLVQHPYCLSLDPQKLEKIRRGFDDLGVKLFFRYLPPISCTE